MTGQEKQQLNEKLAQLRAEMRWWRGEVEKNHLSYLAATKQVERRLEEILAIEKLIDEIKGGTSV